MDARLHLMRNCCPTTCIKWHKVRVFFYNLFTKHLMFYWKYRRMNLLSKRRGVFVVVFFLEGRGKQSEVPRDTGNQRTNKPHINTSTTCMFSHRPICMHKHAPRKGRPGMSDVSPPVWNLRAIIWFHFAISSRVLLPSPVALSVFFFFCLMVHSPDFFPESSSIFFVKRWAFLYGSCLAARRGELVRGMCGMLQYGTGICCYARI